MCTEKQQEGKDLGKDLSYKEKQTQDESKKPQS